jgi:N-acetylmuramoyl-L-alanine amidase
VAVYRRGELPAGGGLPRRLVLDLDGVALGSTVQPLIPVGRGGLARIRAFELDGERIRVSFDVEADAAYRLFFLSDPFRVVMDFRNESRVQPDARPWTVVLDAGHGGEQPGATGPNGLRESHVALALARRVRQALRRQAPQARVLMTRDEDRFVSLEERAAIANAVDADLFVSIHLNASPAQDQGGIATFVLDATDDQAALRLAARENDTDLEGVSKLQLILASLYRRDQVDHSRQLAQDVHRHALRGGRKLLPELNDRGVKSALFYVLVGAQMPAILIEASFITRPREAAALASDDYRQALADGIAEGIVRYLER